MRKQPLGDALHHSGSALDSPASLTIMASRSTDVTLRLPCQSAAPSVKERVAFTEESAWSATRITTFP